MTLATILGGACALLFGRQLFWLFVGVLGFVVGSHIATTFYANASPSVTIAIAAVAGLAGAVLAYGLQEVMIAVAGFAAGSYIASNVLLSVIPFPGRELWLALLLGGFGGLVLFSFLFDWAVIVMSSIFGAGLIVGALAPGSSGAPLAILGLALIGIVSQVRARRRSAARR